MEHVHWWLAGLAFTLGMVLTSTLMVRPVEHQVLVKKSVRGSSAKSKPPTARKTRRQVGHQERGVADGEDQGGNGVCCGADPGCRGARGGADPGRRRAGGAYSGGSVRAVRPGLGARWCRWQRTAGVAGEGPLGHQALLHSRRSDVRPYCRPGLVPGRGVGSAGVFHAVAQEHTADMRSGPQG